MFQPNYSHQEKHIEVLAYLYIVFGVLAVGIGLVLAPVIAGSGAISGDENAIWVTSLVGGGFGFFLSAMGAVSILGGWGLLKRHNWARILVIVISILNLPGFPIGTVLGVYGLWVLLNDQSKFEFSTHP